VGFGGCAHANTPRAMARIWLPMGRAPKGSPVDERDVIGRRLRELGVALPELRTMDMGQLREILHWQEERAARPEPDRPTPTPGLTREQIIRELREYRNHLRARQEGRRSVY